MKKISILTLFLLLSTWSFAESYDDIVNSENFYYGEGVGETEAEAYKDGLTKMLHNISLQVTSGFEMITEENNINGKLDSKTQVSDWIKTYSQASFKNVKTLPLNGNAQNKKVLVYMKRKDLEEIFQYRIQAAKNFVKTGDEALNNENVDIALQCYYLAYSMVRSVQFPHHVKDDKGTPLVTALPNKIIEILRDIKVEFVSQEEQYVFLSFTYKGKDVRSLDFSFWDGQSDCTGCKATGGDGSLEMATGHEDDDVFYVTIDYENKSYIQGDEELNSILNVIPKKKFPDAVHKVKRNKSQKGNVKDDKQGVASLAFTKVAAPLVPSATQRVEDSDMYVRAMERIEAAFRTKNYFAVRDLFDMEGLAVFKQVTSYGTPRLVGEQNISFFKGAAGTVTARGLKAAFTFTSPKKATFTEDLVFTFNKQGKICNVTFGLGKEAEQDILCRNVDWGDDVKAQITEFMENYKTAYCLKRLDYIKDIFADDAVIIVGRVIRKNGGTTNIGEQKMTNFGYETIEYNRQTKDQYLANLEKCFKNPRNKYINVKFAENDIQSLNSFNDNKVFGIQIKQLYNSATYGDVGYLFLIVDMTDPEKPQIKVRTWQPNQTPIEERYNAGFFY